jgi:hypothetical protein
MKIYDEIKFNNYLGNPIRVKRMFPDIVPIAEGALLATFKTIEELRECFPYGNYKVIDE